MTEQPTDPTIGIIDPSVVFLTIEQAARVYNVSPDTMRRICRGKPRFLVRRINGRGEYRIYRPSFVAWLLSPDDDASTDGDPVDSQAAIIDLATAAQQRS